MIPNDAVSAAEGLLFGNDSPPVCTPPTFGTDANGHTTFSFTAQDTGDGIKGIVVTTQTEPHLFLLLRRGENAFARGLDERREDERAVGGAEQGIDCMLRMRHQAHDVAVLVHDSRDVVA